MHSVLTLLQVLGSTPGFLIALLLLAVAIGVASGSNLTPGMEASALSFALMKMPGVLEKAGPCLQYIGTLILVCWALSVLIMLVRFFCISWLDWNSPSVVQLGLVLKERLQKRDGELA
jgi:hypothetical protein